MENSMKQEFRVEVASTEEKESLNASVVQELEASRVQTDRVCIDKMLLDQISKTIKVQMRELIKQIKVSEKEEDNDCEPKKIRVGDTGASSKKKRKGRRQSSSEPCGEVFGSFQLPKIDILNNIDINRIRMLTKLGEDMVVGDNIPTFLVAQRLQDWKIEGRKRKKGATIDYFYYHSPSDKSFRSKPEVIQFILTETGPLAPSRSRKAPSNARKAFGKIRKSSQIFRKKRMTVRNVERQHMLDEVVVSSNLAKGDEGQPQSPMTKQDGQASNLNDEDLPLKKRRRFCIEVDLTNPKG
ncbi:hypothetical protein RIF29_29418 [Crotalaria pallida]|uniref:MBD domain-containing protein n=1 Tax=Crotalaria pallida TaxID=3830 RepID=A0AAN9EEJ7_CROPI